MASVEITWPGPGSDWAARRVQEVLSRLIQGEWAPGDQAALKEALAVPGCSVGAHLDLTAERHAAILEKYAPPTRKEYPAGERKPLFEREPPPEIELLSREPGAGMSPEDLRSAMDRVWHKESPGGPA